MSDDDFLEQLRQQELSNQAKSEPAKPAAPARSAEPTGPQDVVAQVDRADDSDESSDTLQGFLDQTDTSVTETDAQYTSGRPWLDKLLRRHAPRGWHRHVSPDLVAGLIDSDETAQMIIMSADIRKSTLLMRETVSFPEFASIISGFVTSAARFIRWGQGWFDKFTGDGFLAYWIVPSDDKFKETLESALQASYHILATFQSDVLRDLKKNSRNFPAGVGLSIGLDTGPTHLVKVAGELTVVGHPVVGAVRMCGAAKLPGQLMCNLRVGEYVQEHQDSLLPDKKFDTYRLMGATKEYDAQETFLVEFHDVET